jgi:hypothetical protein
MPSAMILAGMHRPDPQEKNSNDGGGVAPFVQLRLLQSG